MRSQFKQFGMKGFLTRGAKRILRIIYVSVDEYKLLSLEETSYYKENQVFSDTRSVNLEDFISSKWLDITQDKLDVIKDRFESGYCECYGVYNNNELFCYCWLTYNQIVSPCRGFELVYEESSYAFVVDGYCHPDFRGKGVYSQVIGYLINRAFLKGIRTIKCFVLRENTPGIKALVKWGFQVDSSYLFIQVFKYKWILVR